MHTFMGCVYLWFVHTRRPFDAVRVAHASCLLVTKLGELSERQRLTSSKKFNGSTKFCIDWSQKTFQVRDTFEFGQTFGQIWSEQNLTWSTPWLALFPTISGNHPNYMDGVSMWTSSINWAFFIARLD